MQICYVDESGDGSDLKAANDSNQPAFVIAGMIINSDDIPWLTTEFVSLKNRFFPNLPPTSTHFLSRILGEIKGADLRKSIALGPRKHRRHATMFLQEILERLRRVNASLIGRVWIKGIGQPFDDKAVYTSSVQAICQYYQAFLADQGEYGYVIADHRSHALNRSVAHSVFTQKFSVGGAYDRVLEIPTFGVSDNHAGIQICDLLVSAIIFPMAVHTYCNGHVSNVHVRSGYWRVKANFAQAIRNLQYRYELDGRWKGGLTVSDSISQLPGGLLFNVNFPPRLP